MYTSLYLDSLDTSITSEIQIHKNSDKQISRKKGFVSKEIELFFKTYKELEKNKWVKIDSFDSAVCANQLIEKYSISI